MTKIQRGFTLIELIVVIVILGILAATALPKFLDVQSQAKIAAITGAAGAMNSAAGLAHAAQLVAGTSGAAGVSLGGQPITMINGYPTADAPGIFTAASISGNDWTLPGAGVVQLKTGPSSSCQAVYTVSASGPTVTTAIGC